MTRVIAGVAGGRRLLTPSGRDTRPTSDRVREGLFSTLESLYGPLTGVSFLDLYAGSGAVGIEAASRGAAHVLLVERNAAALKALRANLKDIRLPGLVARADSVERVLAGPPDRGYDLVFIDPPYSDSVDLALAALTDGGWLTDRAVVVVERATRHHGVHWPEGLAALQTRKYGDSTLCYGSRS